MTDTIEGLREKVEKMAHAALVDAALELYRERVEADALVVQTADERDSARRERDEARDACAVFVREWGEVCGIAGVSGLVRMPEAARLLASRLSRVEGALREVRGHLNRESARYRDSMKRREIAGAWVTRIDAALAADGKGENALSSSEGGGR